VVDPSTEGDVRRAERALYAAMVARDFAAFERLLAPDLVYVHSTAVVETRAEYLAGVARGLYEYESVASRAVRFRGNDSFVLQDGICDMRVGATGRPPQMIHLLFVLVWSKAPSGWQLLHRHATHMPHAGHGATEPSLR
jgi:ketosteroid isomerase-like protein